MSDKHDWHFLERAAAHAAARAAAQATARPHIVYCAGGRHGDAPRFLWCEEPPGGFPGASVVLPGPESA